MNESRDCKSRALGCGGFGSSLCCPPHTPRPAETRAMLDGYRRAVLFESPRGQAKRIAAALEREVFLAGHYRACGIDVYATARRLGFTINAVRTRRDPQHYYGLVLIE